jgi:hypothetical protein
MLEDKQRRRPLMIIYGNLCCLSTADKGFRISLQKSPTSLSCCSHTSIAPQRLLCHALILCLCRPAQRHTVPSAYGTSACAHRIREVIAYNTSLQKTEVHERPRKRPGSHKHAYILCARGYRDTFISARKARSNLASSLTSMHTTISCQMRLLVYCSHRITETLHNPQNLPST